LSDVQRLRLLAQTAGDRAAAAAKRLPRDGRLVSAARGELSFNRDLTIALAAIPFAFAGLGLVIGVKLVQASARALTRMASDDAHDEYEYDSELLEIGRASNWRPL
jgi:hypothetical protein